MLTQRFPPVFRLKHSSLVKSLPPTRIKKVAPPPCLNRLFRLQYDKFILGVAPTEARGWPSQYRKIKQKMIFLGPA